MSLREIQDLQFYRGKKLLVDEAGQPPPQLRALRNASNLLNSPAGASGSSSSSSGTTAAVTHHHPPPVPAPLQPAAPRVIHPHVILAEQTLAPKLLKLKAELVSILTIIPEKAWLWGPEYDVEPNPDGQKEDESDKASDDGDDTGKEEGKEEGKQESKGDGKAVGSSEKAPSTPVGATEKTDPSSTPAAKADVAAGEAPITGEESGSNNAEVKSESGPSSSTVSETAENKMDVDVDESSEPKPTTSTASSATAEPTSASTSADTSSNAANTTSSETHAEGDVTASAQAENAAGTEMAVVTASEDEDAKLEKERAERKRRRLLRRKNAMDKMIKGIRAASSSRELYDIFQVILKAIPATHIVDFDLTRLPNNGNSLAAVGLHIYCLDRALRYEDWKGIEANIVNSDRPTAPYRPRTAFCQRCFSTVTCNRFFGHDGRCTQSTENVTRYPELVDATPSATHPYTPGHQNIPTLTPAQMAELANRKRLREEAEADERTRKQAMQQASQGMIVVGPGYGAYACFGAIDADSIEHVVPYIPTAAEISSIIWV
jgi:hypothetical protein